MSQLSYKTRKNASIYGIPKVYFCCHPKDFDGYFEEISNEILAKQNCSIWHHGKTVIKYTDEVFDNLGQMHLFVVPVTRRFLKSGNPALETEFRFAAEHNIPILPLMQENGLETLFNRQCGNLQFLDKYNNDSTCLEYNDKLGKFLDSVLLGDSLTQKIRDAFDAYIFLSYRKKDRRHAQELMQLIHKNEFCRDIAIWYDEFLVPGEDFNDAISQALKKSQLFLLTVTPNLVNENNYIMNVEFPMAKEQGKPILPCEMVSTDKALLSEKYQDIPDCTDGHDSSVLSDSLRRHFLDIATQERNSSPEHLFFMGLAYLNGIDVEVNRDYALKLITDAAQQDLIEAIEQLINMYTNGIGVKIDLEKILYWRYKLLDITKRKHDQEKTFASAMAYLGAHFEMVKITYDQSRYDDAISLAKEHKGLCKWVYSDVDCSEADALSLHRHTALSDLMLGRAYHVTKEFELAKKHYDEASKAYERLNERLENHHILQDTTGLYCYIAQLCKVNGEYAQALEYYEKALHIQQYCAENYGAEEHLLYQANTLVHISEIQRILWDTESAVKNCLAALKIIDELSTFRETRQYQADRMVTLLALGDSYRIKGDFSNALQVLAKLIPLEEKFLEQYGPAALSIRVRRLMRTAQVYHSMDDFASVIQYAEEALALLDNTYLATDANLATGGTDQSTLYLLLGIAYFNATKNHEKALEYAKKGCELAERFLECGIQCNIADVVLSHIACGEFLLVNNQLSEASQHLHKAASIYETYLSKEDSFRNLVSGFSLYLSLGWNQMKLGALSDAIATLDKAERLYQRMDNTAACIAISVLKDYCKLCYFLAACYTECDDSRDVDYYLKCIECYDQIPEAQYNMSDWNIIGIVAYQLMSLSSGFLKVRKWKKRLLDASHKIRTLYPAEYKQTFFYEALADTGIFE